jgi:hypothetical protein
LYFRAKPAFYDQSNFLQNNRSEKLKVYTYFRGHYVCGVVGKLACKTTGQFLVTHVHSTEA